MAYTLKAEPREIAGIRLDQLRENKKIPAVLYGLGKDSQNIQLMAQDFEKLYSQAGENQVVELTIADKKSVDVLIKEVQINPVKRIIIHADLLAIDVNKTIEVEIPLNYVGEAPAVKATGGSLIKNLDSVHVSCKPKDMVPSFDVNVDSLETLEDNILVSDLKVPESFKILSKLTELVATVIPPRVEVEEEEPAEEGEEAVEGEEKKEGEEETSEGEDGKEKGKPEEKKDKK